MNIFERARQLNFPPGHYILVGGATMEAYGLRKADDIDVCVSPKLFEKLRMAGWEVDQPFKEKWGRVRLKRNDIEVFSDVQIGSRSIPIEDFIQDSILIRDLPFMRLEILLELKHYNDREKDLKDIKLIEEYLKANNNL